MVPRNLDSPTPSETEMPERDTITASTIRFEKACANLAGALERFADHASQIARDFKSTTEIIRTTTARRV